MQTGVLFASGGALGSYDIGVLKGLYEIEPDFTPNIVTGISMGAIHAAIMASTRGNPTKILEALWERFVRISLPFIFEPAESFLALLLNPHFYQLRQDYWFFPFWTSFYNPLPLRKIIEDFIDFDVLNTGPTRIIISATNIETAEIEYFDNQGPNKTIITADHILASCSLPLSFPMVELNQSHYWDGGLFDSDPLTPLLERLDSKMDGVRRLVVISLYPSQDGIPNSLFDGYIRMIGLILANKLKAMIETLYKANSQTEQIKAFCEALPKNSRLRRHPQFSKLQKSLYIEEIIHICNTDPKLTQGNLSRESLHSRIEAGYRDVYHKFF